MVIFRLMLPLLLVVATTACITRNISRKDTQTPKDGQKQNDDSPHHNNSTTNGPQKNENEAAVCKPLYPTYSRNQKFEIQYLTEHSDQKALRTNYLTTILSHVYAGQVISGTQTKQFQALHASNPGYTKGATLGTFIPASPVLWFKGQSSSLNISNFFTVNFRFDNQAVAAKLPIAIANKLKSIAPTTLDIYWVAQDIEPVWQKKITVNLSGWLLASSDAFNPCKSFDYPYQLDILQGSDILASDSGHLKKEMDATNPLFELEGENDNLRTRSFWSVLSIPQKKQAVVTLHWLLGPSHFQQTSRLAASNVKTVQDFLTLITSEELYTQKQQSLMMLNELKTLLMP